MQLQHISKLDPELREDCFQFIMRNPVVRKWTNCVAFATLDPFGCILRETLTRAEVVPQIVKTPEAKIPKNFDIKIWWDDVDVKNGSYHFALIDGDCYKMQTSRGGKFIRDSIATIDAHITPQFQHSKRVHRFVMPIRPCERKSKRYIEKFYEAFYSRKFTELLKVIELYDDCVLGRKEQRKKAA